MTPSLVETVGTVVLLGAIVTFALRNESRAQRAGAARALALGLVVVAVVAGGLVAWRVVYPPSAVATATLAVDSTLEVPAHDGALELLVHGALKDGATSGRYELVVGDAAGRQVLSGEFDHTTTTRRATRRVPTRIETLHLERTHNLAASTTPVKIAVQKTSDGVAGPLTLTVVPPPPSQLAILLFGVIAAFVVAVLDRRTSKNAFTPAVIGVPIAFALLLLQSAHPLELGHFVRVVPMAAVLGLLGAGALTVIAKLVPAASTKSPASPATTTA